MYKIGREIPNPTWRKRGDVIRPLYFSDDRGGITFKICPKPNKYVHKTKADVLFP